MLFLTSLLFFFTKLCLVLFWLQMMDGPGENEAGLQPAGHPRFCEEIRRGLPAYSALFTRVFQNKTFHVYRLQKEVAGPPAPSPSGQTR